MTELPQIMKTGNIEKEIMCLYTDGGPDHRVTYLSVQVSLICLFLRTNADMVIAVRTPPQNSWKDPAERVMPILNIGLQSVGLMRRSLSDVALEHKLKSAKNMKGIRAMVENTDGLKEQVIESVRPVKELLEDIFSRLKQKDKNFKTFHSASDEDINKLWTEILKIDPTLTPSDTTKEKIKSKEKLIEFMKGHCVQRHYMFSLKKCDQLQCQICDVPRLPPSIVNELHNLPDPVPKGEQYVPFRDLYGTNTTEEHRPSLKEVKVTSHGMPFSPTAQFAKTL